MSTALACFVCSDRCAACQTRCACCTAGAKAKLHRLESPLHARSARDASRTQCIASDRRQSRHSLRCVLMTSNSRAEPAAIDGNRNPNVVRLQWMQYVPKNMLRTFIRALSLVAILAGTAAAAADSPKPVASKVDKKTSKVAKKKTPKKKKAARKSAKKKSAKATKAKAAKTGATAERRPVP